MWSFWGVGNVGKNDYIFTLPPPMCIYSNYGDCGEFEFLWAINARWGIWWAILTLNIRLGTRCTTRGRIRYDPTKEEQNNQIGLVRTLVGWIKRASFEQGQIVLQL